MNIESFWAQKATDYVTWIRPWEQVLQGDWQQGNLRWFEGGQLNVSANCLDRHLPHKAHHTALIWEGDEEQEQQKLSFLQLHQAVCRMANALKSLGIQKGDTVAIYLPMIPEAAIAMLACARIGAVHTVIFAGFSATALAQRVKDSASKLLITADGYRRGGKLFELKKQADKGIGDQGITQLIIRHMGTKIDYNPKYDHFWDELGPEMSPECTAEPMDAEDPLFILYTSGSTGKPKGLVHSTGGYLVQVAYSHDYVFQCHANDVFWCTADVGWITGHSYLLYGPLCNGITTLLFAGVPTWPTPSRYWQIIDRHQVNVFYTSPTALRALKREGEQWLNNSSRRTLRLLGTVGEPINPEVWTWYQQEVGLNHCPIADTWWQTETGAIMICPQVDLGLAKPGAASQALPGIYLALLNENGEEIIGPGEGALVIKQPWPSLARTILGDASRYLDYFNKGYYLTGDGAKRDEDGDYWITGRLDDVLNVSGHRLGTAEIENALIAHPKVAEAAVVGISHPIKGQGIHAYVSLKRDSEPSEALKDALMTQVKNAIGAIAKPDVIQWVSDLPKTRSGKIMRRILRELAANKITDISQLGDLSTLANPQIIEHLMAEREI